MKVNARGDELGKGGKIVRTREQIMSTYYENNPKATPDVDNPTQQQSKAPAPSNPPSQTMKIEDTPVSAVVQDAPKEQMVKTEEAPAEEQVLDKGVEAVQKARARRRGIADATGEK